MTGQIVGEDGTYSMYWHLGNNSSDKKGGYFSYSFDIDIGMKGQLHLIEELIGAEEIPLMLDKFFWNGLYNCPRLCTIWIGRGHPKDFNTYRFQKQIDIMTVKDGPTFKQSLVYLMLERERLEKEYSGLGALFG